MRRGSGEREKSRKRWGWEKKWGVWTRQRGSQLPSHGCVIFSGLHQPPRFADEETEAQEIHVFVSLGTLVN